MSVEAEFCHAAGNILDEVSSSIRSDIAGGAKEHFKITVKPAPPDQAILPDSKMVVNVTGGHSMPF